MRVCSAWRCVWGYTVYLFSFSRRSCFATSTRQDILLQAATILQKQYGSLPDVMECHDRLLAAKPSRDSYHESGDSDSESSELNQKGDQPPTEVTHPLYIGRPPSPGRTYWGQAKRERLAKVRNKRADHTNQRSFAKKRMGSPHRRTAKHDTIPVNEESNDKPERPSRKGASVNTAKSGPIAGTANGDTDPSSEKKSSITRQNDVANEGKPRSAPVKERPSSAVVSKLRETVLQQREANEGSKSVNKIRGKTRSTKARNRGSELTMLGCTIDLGTEAVAKGLAATLAAVDEYYDTLLGRKSKISRRSIGGVVHDDNYSLASLLGIQAQPSKGKKCVSSVDPRTPVTSRIAVRNLEPYLEFEDQPWTKAGRTVSTPGTRAAGVGAPRRRPATAGAGGNRRLGRRKIKERQKKRTSPRKTGSRNRPSTAQPRSQHRAGWESTANSTLRFVCSC